MATLLDLIVTKTGLTPHRETLAGEFSMPCPFCRAGEDRFRVWRDENRFWCRVCGRKGDAIQFCRDYLGLSFQQAKAEWGNAATVSTFQESGAGGHGGHQLAPIDPPCAAWQEAAWAFKFGCQALLHSPDGAKALAWLKDGRGLSEQVISAYGLGVNLVDHYTERAAWGLPEVTDKAGRPKGLWLPKGITIPWIVDGEIWGIRIRRPAGEPKYFWLPGGTPGLFNASKLIPHWPAVVVEGELDAMTIDQAGRGLVIPVATGSTHGARRVRWLARLALAESVLVAFDSDQAGEDAAGYWCDALTNARRWRPYWADVNAMATGGADVGAWLQMGLEAANANGVYRRETV